MNSPFVFSRALFPWRPPIQEGGRGGLLGVGVVCGDGHAVGQARGRDSLSPEQDTL